MTWRTLKEMADCANEQEISLGELLFIDEVRKAGGNNTCVYEKMERQWQIMKESVSAGLERPGKSRGGMLEGEGSKLASYLRIGKPLSGSILEAVSGALAASETNAAMGRIVAAPTAGSCGILPGVLKKIALQLNKQERDVIIALFCAAGIGMIIARNASLSGASCGCQAECGSAAAMTAAAAAELAGGKPNQVLDAVALTLKNYLGLVCDPVAGLVEVPCIKRNGIGAAISLVAADMALAGIKSVIPADEVIVAMGKIGKALPQALRETSKGGLAMTPTGQKLAQEIHEKNRLSSIRTKNNQTGTVANL